MKTQNKCDLIRKAIAKIKGPASAAQIAIKAGLGDEPRNVYRKLRYLCEKGEAVWAEGEEGGTVFYKNPQSKPKVERKAKAEPKVKVEPNKVA